MCMRPTWQPGTCESLAVPAACLLSVSQLACPSLQQRLKGTGTPSPVQQAYQLRRQQRKAGGAPTHLKKLSGEHLPAITEEATQGSQKTLDTPTALPVSPFADTPAVLAAATEAGHGPEAAQVLSATGKAGTADALPPVLSGMLGTHGSVAIAPAASGLGSQRLMSVRLTANSGLIYNTAPIPTVLPAEGAWLKRCCGSLHLLAILVWINVFLSAALDWLITAGVQCGSSHLCPVCCRLEAHWPAGTPCWRPAPHR